MLEYELVVSPSRSEKQWRYSIRTIYRSDKDTRKVLSTVECVSGFADKLNAFDAGCEAMAVWLREMVH